MKCHHPGGRQTTEGNKFTGNKSPASHLKTMPEGQKLRPPEGKKSPPRPEGERTRPSTKYVHDKSVVLRMAKPCVLIGCNKKTGE